MSEGYSVWDDLGQQALVVDYVGDLGVDADPPDGSRVYERDTGQLLEWNRAEKGWKVVRQTPQQVITPGNGVFGIRRRSIWRAW